MNIISPFLKKLNFYEYSDLKKYFVKGISGSFAIRGINIIVKLFISILLARVLGEAEMGVYSYFLSLITLLLLPAKMGVPTLLIRETARMMQQKKWSALKGMTIKAFRIIGLVSLIVIVLTFFLSWIGKDFIQEKRIHVFWYGLMIIPFAALYKICEAVLKGNQRIIFSLLPDQIVRPMFFLLVLFFVYFFEYSFLAQHAMIWQSLSAFLAFSFALCFFYYKLPKPFFKTKVDHYPKKLARQALPFLLFGSIGIIYQQTDIILITHLRGYEDVATYKFAVTASRYIYMISVTINSVLSPVISKFYYKGDLDYLNTIVKRVTRVTVFMVLPLFFAFVFFGEDVLRFLYTDRYVAGKYALMILTFGFFLNVLTGPKSELLSMTGHEKILLKGRVFSLILNIILNFFLIKLYGINGAAIATSLSILFWVIYLLFYVKRKVNINPLPLN